MSSAEYYRRNRKRILERARLRRLRNPEHYREQVRASKKRNQLKRRDLRSGKYS